MKKLLFCLPLIGLLFGCTDSKIPIAIVTPITHPSLEQIEKGFKETIEAKYPEKYRFVVYNAQGNKTLMRAEIDEISTKGYALVLTIGTVASHMAVEVKQLSIPIVFTAVHDVAGLDAPNVTGVKELLDFEGELQAMLKLKPDIHRVLLVFNPMEPGLSANREEVGRLLRAQGIDLLTVEVFQTNELQLKVSPFISQVDALLVLKDNTVIGGLDFLVKLCKAHRILLVTSDLDSPKKGASLGYGVHESEFGVEAAKKALQILDDHIPPEQIPVTPVTHFIAQDALP